MYITCHVLVYVVRDSIALKHNINALLAFAETSQAKLLSIRAKPALLIVQNRCDDREIAQMGLSATKQLQDLLSCRNRSFARPEGPSQGPTQWDRLHQGFCTVECIRFPIIHTNEIDAPFDPEHPAVHNFVASASHCAAVFMATKTSNFSSRFRNGFDILKKCAP